MCILYTYLGMGLISGLGLVAIRLELNTRSNIYLHTTTSSNLSPPERHYHYFHESEL
jgi:hypothetical protein